MSDVLVLTADEAAKVRGVSPRDGGRALNPVPLKDGTFFLNEAVLDDPAHEDVVEFLAAMPRVSLERLPTNGPDDLDVPASEEVALMGVREADRREPTKQRPPQIEPRASGQEDRG